VQRSLRGLELPLRRAQRGGQLAALDALALQRRLHRAEHLRRLARLRLARLVGEM